MNETNYYWIREIARGGMGRVDLIVRSEGAFQRLCAAKRLHPQLSDDPDCRTMFLDEARIAGMLKHPNIVSVFDVGDDEQGPYLIMDYVHGVSLRALVRKSAHDRAHIPMAIAVQIAVQIADGLHAAHEVTTPDGRSLELVHRDVSPHNVLVGYDGLVKVTDFGIARALGRTTKTSTGVLKGKLAYMSPEQLRFRPADRRSDLFSFGILLYEMLTSTRLYPNRDGEGPLRILEEPPPDVGLERDGVPPALVELTFRLLAKDPAKRPQTAAIVAARLREIQNDLMLDDAEALTLADYVATQFESETTGHRRAIGRAFEQLERGELEPWPKTSPTLELPLAQSPPRWPFAAAGALVLLTIAGAGAYVSWNLPDAPAAEAHTPAVNTPPVDTPPVTSPARTSPPVVLPAPIAETPLEETTQADTTTQRDEEPVTEPSVRRQAGPASMRRRRVREEPTESSVTPVAMDEPPVRDPLAPVGFGDTIGGP